ncbi:MAG TPA: cold shock domain-containing protein [Stellaceae bacterium]|nr:cold shock domain-containing protein [Stellaceae bacterium]
MSYQQGMGDSQRLSGKVKWFNRSKGFGFVIPNDGSGDVFLPLAVLERAGFNEAPDGASVVFDCVHGAKGRAVASILELDTSTAQPRPPRGDRPDRGGGFGGGGFGGRRERNDHMDEPTGPTESLDGVVKWYDPQRGFGFILPNDGGKDIFVHVTALRRSGIDTLEPGQAVRMQVGQARRGREASSIQLA